MGQTACCSAGDGQDIRLDQVPKDTTRQDSFVRETLAALEGPLDPQQFMRVHRRAIASIDAVEVRPRTHGRHEMALRSGGVGRTQRRRLSRVLGTRPASQFVQDQ
jgi:DNA-binding LytR/AlgR family response regulator